MKPLSFYDVIIIGAGPAGIFAAFELAKRSNLSILLLEKGQSLTKRVCPNELKNNGCLSCSPCARMSGWGGAGAFSDGKLDLTTKMGGWLNEYLNPQKHQNLVRKAELIWSQFGAPQRLPYPKNQIRKIARKAKKAGFKLISFPIRHLGSDKTPKVLENFYQYLKNKIEIHTLCPVRNILVKKNHAWGVKLKNKKNIKAKYIITAPGREGNGWFFNQLKRLCLKVECNPIDLGVRVETKASTLEPLTKSLYEAKLIFKGKTFQDLTRTFCMCPYGEVITERLEGKPSILTVNGHSKKDFKTKNSNFAILVSTKFTEPFKDPLLYGKDIAHLANLLGQEVLIQRLGDLLKGRRSIPARIKKGQVIPTLKSATPGDLSFVLPYRHLKNILEMLENLDKLAPGLFSSSTLLYGVEVKFYSVRPKLSADLETQVKNLFACGDGAGITRGLIQASVSGLAVAQSIIKKEVA